MMEHLIEQLRAAGIRQDVLDIMSRVPREQFVDDVFQEEAFENMPLSIGYEQTISQPYIVARMTEALCQLPLRRVLEIGTGSGYQTAILSYCATDVYTIERIKPLYLRAKALLNALELNNIHFYYGDGHDGLPAHAPFDGIIVTAALLEVPHALLSQLAIDGRFVAPVGRPGAQTLQVITRTSWGFETEDLEDVRFVPCKSGVE